MWPSWSSIRSSSGCRKLTAFHDVTSSIAVDSHRLFTTFFKRDKKKNCYSVEKMCNCVVGCYKMQKVDCSFTSFGFDDSRLLETSFPSTITKCGWKKALVICSLLSKRFQTLWPTLGRTLALNYFDSPCKNHSIHPVCVHMHVNESSNNRRWTLLFCSLLSTDRFKVCTTGADVARNKI